MDFPLYSIKLKNSPTFDLTQPAQRQEYFHLKAGSEIEKLRTYLKNNTFIGYLLAKKMAGKGTYSKMLQEVLEPDTLVHLSVGDVVRNINQKLLDPSSATELKSELRPYYRGRLPFEKAIDALLNRDTKSVSVPTEFIIAIIKYEIAKLGRKAIFLDGFPRTMDQVSYSLYFRDLINYRDDPDFFVLLDLPQSIIDVRIKERRVCPICQTSKNFLVNPTSKVQYNKKIKQFEMLCDNPSCHEAVLVAKEGDELGVENIRQRLEDDHKLMEHTQALDGVKIIQLRNSVPQAVAGQYYNDYELTPHFSYSLGKNNKVIVHQDALVVPDDNGVPSHSIMAAAVVLVLIKHLVKTLEL